MHVGHAQQTGFKIVIRPLRMIAYASAAVICGALVSTLIGVPAATAEEKKKRIGPPPKVYTALPVLCAKCHKPDGRGGPAYGGFAADLRATALDQEGLRLIIAEGVRAKGMPEFKSVMTKREIEGIASYIEARIKGVYLDTEGNRISAEEAAALDPRKNDAQANQ